MQQRLRPACCEMVHLIDEETVAHHRNWVDRPWWAPFPGALSRLRQRPSSRPHPLPPRAWSRSWWAFVGMPSARRRCPTMRPALRSSGWQQPALTAVPEPGSLHACRPRHMHSHIGMARLPAWSPFITPRPHTSTSACTKELADAAWRTRQAPCRHHDCNATAATAWRPTCPCCCCLPGRPPTAGQHCGRV